MASGLEGLLHRPRPTAWQLFLRQPCVYLAYLLFSWRRIVPAQALAKPVSVVCISDTHNMQPSLPDGDILIHAGDLTQSGTQPHPVKVVIAGNHDLLLDANRDGAKSDDDYYAQQRRALDWGDIVYLENTEANVVCPNGRELRIYGSPLSARHGNWAFQYDRSHDVWADKTIPSGVDILLTHGPPRAHLDLQLGCVYLLRELRRVRPRLHVFGHVHEGVGTEWVQFDALQAAYEQTVIDRGGVLNLCAVFVRWAQQALASRPAVEAKCRLVNPSMVGGLWDKERRSAIRVQL